MGWIKLYLNEQIHIHIYPCKRFCRFLETSSICLGHGKTFYISDLEQQLHIYEDFGKTTMLERINFGFNFGN